MARKARNLADENPQKCPKIPPKSFFVRANSVQSQLRNGAQSAQPPTCARVKTDKKGSLPFLSIYTLRYDNGQNRK
jgi:hypothetical protein